MQEQVRRSMPNARGTVMATAQAALHEVISRLVRLVRAIPDPNVPSIGSWRVGDVAAHLSHVLRVDADALAGKPLPPATVTKTGMDEVTARMLLEDSERNPAKIADNIGDLFRAFDEVASLCQATTVDWLQGARIPPSAVACHLLEECLVHGHDIATATNQPWVIEPHHALLTIESFALPLIHALPTTALLDQERAQSVRARIEMRLRGGERIHMVINDGSLILDSGAVSSPDAYVSVDPAAFLLMFMGRQGMLKPLVTGRAVAWGRKPWKLVRALGVLTPP